MSELQRLLDGRWADVRAEARAVAEREEFRPVYDLPRADYRERVMKQARQLADGGYTGRGFPAEFGGTGPAGDLGGSVTAFEMLAFGDLSLLVKCGVQWGLFGGAVLQLGTERHHRYLPDIISLALPGCFAMTETGHGSDVAKIRTTATYDRATERFTVSTPDESARKDYIGNAAAHGRMAVVFARLITRGVDEGVHGFLVPIRDEQGRPCGGVTIGDCGPKAGLEGVDNGRLSFAGVQVPRDALLDRYGQVGPDGAYTTSIANPRARFFTMLGTLIAGRVSVAGGAGSAAKLALAIALRYGERRRQFAAPGTVGAAEEIAVLDYRAHQRRLLPLLARTYALHFAQLDLVETLHEVFTHGGDARARRELEARSAGVKALGTWHATHAIQTAREACGGAGYLAENRLPALRADTDVFTTFEGDNTVLLQLVAKELLVGYRSEFGSLDTLGLIRFGAEQLGSAVLERTAARGLVQRLIDARPGRDDALLDRGTQLELLDWRERHLRDTLARRLRRAKPDSGGAFAAFNATQPHQLALARAHVERMVTESFVAAVDRCRDTQTAALLGRVCDLHVLAALEADRGWFVEHGRLTPSRSKTITPAVDALCSELRPHAGELVDALAIPPAALDVPILR